MPLLQAVAATSAPTLHLREFEKIRSLAHRHFGLDLSRDKQSLVASRLEKELRKLGLGTYTEYYEYVSSDRTGAALATMVDRLTTNHTGFFREPAHFEFLRTIIFHQLRNRSRIHLWSAACSTGEEPYSIAMSLLEESPREAAAKVRIKATDISMRALEKARAGSYGKERLSAVAPALQQRYFCSSSVCAGDLSVTANLRWMVDFQHLNLISPLPAAYLCSVIFCRNLMIYFDRPTQQDLVNRLTQNLEDGGYLFIGHAETLNNITHTLEYICPAIYRKPPALLQARVGTI